MADEQTEDILSKASPAFKRELLDKLVSALLRGLNESGKKDVLRAVLAGRKAWGRKAARSSTWWNAESRNARILG